MRIFRQVCMVLTVILALPILALAFVITRCVSLIGFEASNEGQSVRPGDGL